ncbi:MAG: protein-methionine-sulfoxide reductase heme-binding subunit MsrQ [Pseudomonadota bacterium]
MPKDPVRRYGKPLVFLASLAPAIWISLVTFGIAGNGLGANPVETLLDFFGNWGLRFILIGLAITPLRLLTGNVKFIWFRRMLGLFGAFYVALHFLVYLILDQGLLLTAVLEDILVRPFITLGMIAVILLTAMTITSTAGMRRRLGKRWQQLHYGAYAVGILGVWHYWWQVKKDITEPAIYAVCLSVLFAIRWWSRRKRQRPVGGLATG